MISANQVAKYFLAKADEDVGDGISNLKLQKLVYYAQAYHLAMHGEPLFGDRLEAWEHGPVVPDLYHAYKEYGAANIPAPSDLQLNAYGEETAEFLDEVYNVFGQYSAWKLRNMTHEERPWVEAYENGERGRVISHAAMRDFYKDYVTE
jgi:uncharacterized phage-associated protein